MATFLPSTYPASLRPLRKLAMIALLASGEAVSRYPITGIVACCARTPTGHAAAPQRAAINSRRLIMSKQQHWSEKPQDYHICRCKECHLAHTGNCVADAVRADFVPGMSACGMPTKSSARRHVGFGVRPEMTGAQQDRRS